MGHAGDIFKLKLYDEQECEIAAFVLRSEREAHHTSGTLKDAHSANLSHGSNGNRFWAIIRRLNAGVGRGFSKCFAFINTNLGLWLLTGLVAIAYATYETRVRNTLPEYDDRLVNDIVAVHYKINSWILNAAINEESDQHYDKNPHFSYRNSISFYSDIESDLTSLNIRMLSYETWHDINNGDDNTLLVESRSEISAMTTSIQKMVENMRMMHKAENYISPNALRDELSIFNLAFSEFLTYEDAVKAGDEKTAEALALARSIK
jgi:hypothetical protein